MKSFNWFNDLSSILPQDLAKALAKIGAITTTVNAIIAVIVASILYIALRPVMKKTDMLRDL